MKRRILTEIQFDLLIALFESGLGNMDYYFTGGSALAEYYLQHRHSDDLDFFTRAERPFEEDFKELRDILTARGLQIPSEDVGTEFARFFVRGGKQDAGPLKIEFARDVPAMMSPAQTHGQVVVDSFEDIAVNKICAILNREPPESKDFVDLLFIVENSEYTIDYLLMRAKEKEAAFDQEDGLLAFATNLLRVEDVRILPRMIKPMSLQGLKAQLAPLAQEIIRRLRPGT